MENIITNNNDKQYPEIAVAIILQHPVDNKILMIKSKIYQNSFRLIKGYIYFGESISDAIKRNVKQEVGYDIEILKLICVQESIFSDEYKDKKHYIFLTYYCKIKSMERNYDIQPLSEFIWIDENDILDITMSKSNRELIRIFLNMKSKEQV